MEQSILSLITFLLIAAFHTSELYASKYYALVQTQEYWIAIAVALVEFVIEFLLFPDLKSNKYRSIFILGCILATIAQVIHKLALLAVMFSTRSTQDNRKYKLVTKGIYRIERHPYYLGWLILAPATQLILLNPVSFGLYLAWTWYFFYDRIPYEEELLMEFFGSQYEQYKSKTRTWIPFIS